MQSRQARIGRTYPLIPVESVRVEAVRRKSVGDLVRQWAPFLLTALVVPGGIAVVLVVLFRRWNQGRRGIAELFRA